MAAVQCNGDFILVAGWRAGAALVGGVLRIVWRVGVFGSDARGAGWRRQRLCFCCIVCKGSISRESFRVTAVSRSRASWERGSWLMVSRFSNQDRLVLCHVCRRVLRDGGGVDGCGGC